MEWNILCVFSAGNSTSTSFTTLRSKRRLWLLSPRSGYAVSILVPIQSSCILITRRFSSLTQWRIRIRNCYAESWNYSLVDAKPGGLASTRTTEFPTEFFEPPSLRVVWCSGSYPCWVGVFWLFDVYFVIALFCVEFVKVGAYDRL